MSTNPTKGKFETGHSTRRNLPQEFQTTDVVTDYFRAELEKGINRFDELVEEAPEEFRMSTAKALLEAEFRFYQKRQWTFDPRSRSDRYPELATFANELIKSSDIETVHAAEGQVPSIALTALTDYEVNGYVWKQGGQGVLHEATDLCLGNRTVIVKFLKDLRQHPQFLKEAHITANLEHPGVVPVYAHGTETVKVQDETGKEVEENNRPFYSMRKVYGDTLDIRIAEFHKKHGEDKQPYANPKFIDLIEALISICNTIEYAHSRGILHCDIKPANIKCGRFNATLVLDWGSAVPFEAEPGSPETDYPKIVVSDTTSCGYTAQYASPEQCKAEDTKLSPEADVFCIGATLFQILTGKPPYDRTRTPDQSCPNPREHHRKIPSKLAAICLRAMSPRVADRYSTVQELGHDLQNWLRDEEVTAAPDTFSEKIFRVLRRHKAISIATALVVAIGSVFAFFGFYQYSTAKHREEYRDSLKKNQDMAYALVEKICKPIARDETGGLLTFKQIAPDLVDLAKSYAEDSQSSSDKRSSSTRAKALRIEAVVNYFKYNDSSEDNQTPDIGLLETALENLEEAKNLNVDFTDDKILYSLFEARVRFKILQEKATGGPELDTLLQQLKTLSDSLPQKLGKDKVPPQDDFRKLLQRAETYHLRGQVFLTLRGLNSSTKDDLVQAEMWFERSVEVRESLNERFEELGLASSENWNEIELYIKRELGRGYGYLGDAQKYLGNVDDAIASYEKSRDFREKVVQIEPSDEYKFQMARGYSNFGNLARDYGDQLLLHADELSLNKSATDRDSPFEVLMIKNYVEKSRVIREELWERTKDGRVREDLSGLYNLTAELYLHAAIDTPDEGQRNEYLQESVRNTKLVLALYPDEDHVALPQDDKNRIATAYMLQVQAKTVAGPSVLEIQIEQIMDRLNGLLNVDQPNSMNFESLLAYCVSLKTADADFTTPENKRLLELLLEKCADDDDKKNDYRVRRTLLLEKRNLQ